MRNRTFLNLAVATGIAASCAGAAVMPPDAAGPSTPASVTLTPVVVHASGRMTVVTEPAAPISASNDTAAPADAARTADRAVLEIAEGEATYYASKFDGRRAASGIVFRNDEAYAAHRTYPFGTVVRVTNLVNERSATVRIIDRGPHGTSARAKRTIIDLSQSVARELDFMRAGRIPVRVEVLEWGAGRK